MPDNDTTITANWKNNSGGGGHSDSGDASKPVFLSDTEDAIKNAKKGDTVSVKLPKGKTTVPPERTSRWRSSSMTA